MIIREALLLLILFVELGQSYFYYPIEYSKVKETSSYTQYSDYKGNFTHLPTITHPQSSTTAHAMSH